MGREEREREGGEAREIEIEMNGWIEQHNVR